MITVVFENKLLLMGGVGRYRQKLQTVDIYDIYAGEFFFFNYAAAQCVSLICTEYTCHTLSNVITRDGKHERELNFLQFAEGNLPRVNVRY